METLARLLDPVNEGSDVVGDRLCFGVDSTPTVNRFGEPGSPLASLLLDEHVHDTPAGTCLYHREGLR